jgi:hypothetical protein
MIDPFPKYERREMPGLGFYHLLEKEPQVSMVTKMTSQ